MKKIQYSEIFPYFHLILIFSFLSSCGLQTGSPTPDVDNTQTIVPATVTVVPTPTATSLPPTPTPTLNPTLPCGGVMQERVYLFLDCDDIRRIRSYYLSNDTDFMKRWQSLKFVVDDYRSRFPAKYNPDMSWDVLWWGPSNYVMRDMGIIYLVTGEDEYARDLKRLLDLVYMNTPKVNRLTNFDVLMPSGQENSGGLLSHPQFGEVLFQSVLFGYFSIRDGNFLTDEERGVYDQFFKNQALLLEEAAIQRGNDIPLNSPLNRNVPMGANVAALSYALAFPDDTAMKDLAARVRNKINWQIGHYFEADGGWGENTEWYGYRVTEGILLLAETLLKNTGEDLYQQNFDGVTIHNICTYFLNIATPNGMTPGLNDSGHYFIDPDLFTLCGERTLDSQLLFAARHFWEGRESAYGNISTGWITPFHSIAWVGISKAQAKLPDYTSIILPSTGVVVLREGWEEDDQYALLQFTASRVHQDFSFGNIYLFSKGPWMVGNGYMGLSGNPTDQHNTVSIDGRNQTETGGEILTFSELDTVGIVSVKGRPYQNLSHTRTLLWAKPWSQWIVVDTLVPSDNKVHLYQLRWFVRGWVASHENALWSFRRVGSGSLWIEMFPSGIAEYAAVTRRTQWEEDVNDADGVEMSISQGGNIRFVSALTSLDDKLAPILNYREEDGVVILRSIREDFDWTWFFPKDNNPLIAGEAACLKQRAGEIFGFCLMNGTNLERDGVMLIHSDAPISIETDYDNGLITVEALVDTSITLQWEERVSGMFESNAPISYNQTDNLLQFVVKSGKHSFTITHR